MSDNRPRLREARDGKALPADEDEDVEEEAAAAVVSGNGDAVGEWRKVDPDDLSSAEPVFQGEPRQPMVVPDGAAVAGMSSDDAPAAAPGNGAAADSAGAVAARVAALRDAAARLAAMDEDTRVVLRSQEAKRLGVRVADVEAAIERALTAAEAAARPAEKEEDPDIEVGDKQVETSEERWDRLITELLPLKGPALSQAIKALASQEKATASAIIKALQAKREKEEKSPPPTAADQVRYPNGYSMTDRGLFYQPPPGPDGQEPKPEKITSTPFELIGETCDEGGGEFGLLMRWQDSNDLQHQWAMPQALVHNDGNVIAYELQRFGLKCSPTKSAHERLKMFLAEVRVPHKILCVARSGWHDTPRGIAFVLLDGTVFGGDGIVLQTQRVARGSAFTLRGTLDEWNDQVGRLAVGNDRMALCICTALAGPLLHIMNEPSGGIHLVGTSKIAKTAVSRAGTSVWGRADGKGLERSWHNTINGLEGAAAECTGMLLSLEEFGMSNPYAASDTIYMLFNETGKSRAAHDGTARARQVWELFVLSTGEVSLQQKMAEAGRRPSAGLLVRFANVPADAGCGFGVFQDMYGFASVEAFGRHLHEVTTTQQYGTAGRAFLQNLVSDYREDPDLLRQALSALRDRFLAEQAGLTGADTQVRSVAGRFAALAAAGELATSYRVLTWPGGEALRAAGGCFQAWLADRGSVGPGEDQAAVEQVRHFIEAHGESRFTTILPEDANAPERLSDRPTVNRVGFRKMVGDQWEYWVLPESWGTTVCKGLSISPSAVAAVLRELGFLLDSTERHPAGRVRVPGEGRIRAYRMAGSILDHEEGDG